MKRTSLALMITLAAGGVALAQETAPAAKAPAKTVQADGTTLKVGDAAPALSIEKWVKGDPVTGFEAGRVYVVEFWATWCGPCIASIPHLTELQAAHKDEGLTVIGVTTKDPNNSLAKVESFVKDKGAAMGYTVAWDKDKATSNAFMKASGQRGIPCSFVVDKGGKIAYIGHPMFLDLVIPDVIAGKWDAKAGAAKVDDVQKDMGGLYQKMESDPKEALKSINEFETKYPSLVSLTGDLKYQAQLMSGDPAASKTGEKLLAKFVKTKDAMSLNGLAWTIVDPKGDVKVKDLDFALKAATEANRIAEEKDPAILDTLARCYFVKGDKAKAIETQKKAVALAKAGENADLTADLEATLKEYLGA